MPTTPRNIRFDDDLYKSMMSLAGDQLSGSYHIHLACRQYIARLEPVEELAPKKPASKGISPVTIKDGWVKVELEFEDIWALYEKKGNRKTAKARYIKLSESNRDAIFKHVPLYVLSTPDKQYRKNFETYINQECWNDEVTPNGGQNQSGRLAAPNRQTPTQRVQARRAEAAARRGSGLECMGNNDQIISPCVDESRGGGTNGALGTTFDGVYTSSD